MARPRVAVLGHYGYGNLGDDGVVAVVVHRLREYLPTAEVYGISLLPEDTERRHGIPSFPIRRESMWPRASREPHAQARLRALPAAFRVPLRLLLRMQSLPRVLAQEAIFLRRAFAFLRGFDLLVVAGSGQLNDFWGGAWKHPFSLLTWARIARLRGTRVVALSVGAGQLSSPMGKRFCRWFLRSTDYCSFRDQPSKALMEASGWGGESPVYPDQGFALAEILGPAHGGRNGAAARAPDAPLTVCFIPVAERAYVSPGGDPGTHRHYLEVVVSFARWLLQRGYRLSFCPSALRYDRQVLAEIRHALGALGEEAASQGRLIDGGVETTEDLIERLRAADLVIASRFHGVVYPAMLGKPVLGIAYCRKMSDLLNDLGIGEYSLDIEHLALEDMQQKFMQLERHRHEIATTLGLKVAEYQRALKKQYERVFSRYRN